MVGNKTAGLKRLVNVSPSTRRPFTHQSYYRAVIGETGERERERESSPFFSTLHHETRRRIRLLSSSGRWVTVGKEEEEEEGRKKNEAKEGEKNGYGDTAASLPSKP